MHSAGRYGDPLNPWADIITVAETWCVSSPDVSGTCAIGIFPSVQARLVLGVPTDVERQDGSAGQDLVHFNAHRCQISVARFILTDIIQNLWSTTLSLSHYKLGVHMAGTREKVTR